MAYWYKSDLSFRISSNVADYYVRSWLNRTYNANLEPEITFQIIYTRVCDGIYMFCMRCSISIPKYNVGYYIG